MDPYRQPLKVVMCKALRVKPKLQRRPQDDGDARNIENLLKKAIGNNRASLRERPYGFQTERP
jgi:hypothetical protein